MQIAAPLTIGLEYTGGTAIVGGIFPTPHLPDVYMPANVTIPADQSFIDVELDVADDNELEPTETVLLKLKPPGGTPYLFADPDNTPVANNITDNDWEIRAVRLGFNGSQEIAKDDGSGNYAGYDWNDLDADGSFDDPWVDLNDNGIQDDGELQYRNPVSYVRSGILDENGNPVDTTVELAISIIIEGTTTGTWNITGSGNGSTFADPAGDTGLFHTFSADAPLGDTIEFFEDLETEWNLERTPPVAQGAQGQPPTTDEDYGPTKNDVYVTGAPASGAFHTVIDIGSRNAQGLNPDVDGEVTVADAIFGEFTDQSVIRVDGTPLIYDPGQAGHTAATPLSRQDGQGQCSAMSDLLFQTLSAQGVIATKRFVQPASPYARFQVKDALVLGGINLSVPNTQFGWHVLIKINADPDLIYDASFGAKTVRGAAATVEDQWESDHVIDFEDGNTGNWIGSNPAGRDLIWGTPPF